MKGLIPSVGRLKPSEISTFAEIKFCEEVDTYLHAHQMRAKRALRYSNAALFIHYAGQGKTRAMISVVEERRTAIGTGNLSAIFIAKLNIHPFIEDEIKKYAREKYGSDVGACGSYRFETYMKFHKYCSQRTDEELVNEFKNCMFVIDEFHNLYSYIRAKDGETSIFSTYPRIRRLFPDNLILAMTATPMLNSPYEINYLAQVLLTADLLPNSTTTFSTTSSALPEELFDVSLNEDCNVAKAIVMNIPVMYKEAPQEIKPRYFGLAYDLTKLEYRMGKISTTPVRQPLKMSLHHTEYYVANFTSRDFYGRTRRNLLCEPNGLENYLMTSKEFSVEGVAEFSILFAYWLQVELQAVSRLGMSAWYFDDLIESGAELFYLLLLRAGWKPWNGIAEPGARYVLSLTSEQHITKALEATLMSPDNFDGHMIRTVIYSKAVRDGISFRNVLRGGSVLGWTDAGQLQADGRRVRLNSFLGLLNNLSKFPKESYELYMSGDNVSPIFYDALVYPDPVAIKQIPDSLVNLAPHFSIDAHMLRIRSEKSKDINMPMEILISGSIDKLAETSNTQVGNYLSYYMSDIGLKDINETSIVDINKMGPEFIDKDVKLRLLRKQFFHDSEFTCEVPIGGNSDIAWGLGFAGHGIAPASVSTTEALNRDVVDDIDVLVLYSPSSAQLMMEVCNLLESSLMKLYEVCFSPKCHVKCMEDLVKVLGTGPFVLLAMYARFWCIGSLTGGNTGIGYKFPSSEETDVRESSRLVIWKSTPTIIDGKIATVDWKVPYANGIYTDPVSFLSAIQQTGSYAINYITSTLHLRQVMVGPAPFFIDPNKANGKTIVTAFPKVRATRLGLLAYDERTGVTSSLLSEAAIISLRSAPCVRAVLVPEYSDATKPNLMSISDVSSMITLKADSPTHPKLFLPWAQKIMFMRFTNQWYT